MKKLLLVSVIVTTWIFSGCVGSPVHMTLTHSSKKSEMKKNNENLQSLNIGMSYEDVISKMGNPQKNEAYPWGKVLLYRTGFSGIYSEAESDFTPIVIAPDNKCSGWGRNFYIDRKKRYEIEIKRSP